ncbi:NifU family protein [Mesonia maritima]|uniref:Fe-S cluster biogenesis protein NfuA n=1 Tax=Mesonia maritima TaxID=1793873 RepID=A0ABU1K3K0_9FLAO|nr:NifU family protein [Mesonia maritima]MDR6300195.1 Fe-S cluster biogenesis protein NfuA [Mesonia maritima]
MNNYNIEIKPTSNDSIVKFEANRFLVEHETFEFKNIEEASKSPLAQQLFHLPFVKTVFIAQNFVAIEKFNIVEWNDVQNEVATQINEYLNDGGIVVNSAKDSNKNIPVTVYAESTPNPKVMKFVSNRKLVLSVQEFKNIDEASNSPLAQSLFHFPFVKEVFIDENYISVSKYDIAEWEEITLELREFIRNYLQEGKTVLKENVQETAQPQQTEEKVSENFDYLDDTSKQIIAILDEYVKPAVASDGGNIKFESYNAEDKRVKVILQGACSGCPSSTFTLKNGIENMLKEMLHDKVETVEAING